MPPKTQGVNTKVEPSENEGARQRSGIRQKFHWIVTLHRSDGQVSEVPYEAYWSPEREDIGDQVKEWCAAEHSVFNGGTITNGVRQFSFSGVSAQLVTA